MSNREQSTRDDLVRQRPSLFTFPPFTRVGSQVQSLSRPPRRDPRAQSSSFEIGWLKAADTKHFGPVHELDVAPLAPDQALALHIGEHAIAIDRGLPGDVCDLVLRERI